MTCNKPKFGPDPSSMVTRLTFDEKKQKVIKREIINGPPDGIIRIPDEMLPTIATIIRAGMEAKARKEAPAS